MQTAQYSSKADTNTYYTCTHFKHDTQMLTLTLKITLTLSVTLCPFALWGHLSY